MKLKVFLFVLLISIQLSIPDVVLAGNPPLPTQGYIDYINNGRFFITIFTFLFLLIINFSVCLRIFKKFKIKIANHKLLFFTIITTFLANLSNYFLYTLVLPDAYSPGMFGGNSVISGVISAQFSQISFLILLFFFFLNPAYLISFFVSFISSSYLFKNYLKISDKKEKIVLRISVIFLPILGIIIALLFSAFYYHFFSFVGNKY